MVIDVYLRQIHRGVCAWLAVQRWGPTGWRCPKCSSTRGTQLRTRPRVVQCNNCPCQRSVTGSTAFAYTKLPLHLLLPAFRAGLLIRSCPIIQHTLRVARSTAWHIQQRALRVLDRAFDSDTDVDALHQKLLVPLRSTGRQPLAAHAPPFFQQAQRRRGWTQVPVRIHVVGDLAQVGLLGPSPVELHRTIGEYADGVRGLRRFVLAIIAQRLPSLRWGPRWVGGLVTTHAAPFRDVPFEAWWARAVALGHAARRRFEPWTWPGPWVSEPNPAAS